MKKVAIIGTAGIPARYGGFETLAHQLVQHLNGSFAFTVYCSAKFYKPEERKKTYMGARMVYLPIHANGIQSILYDIVSILHALFYADALIVLGVSGCILLPLIKLFTKKKIVVNIDGLEWKRGKWSWPVRKFLQFSEYLAVRYSDADITDNAAIKRYTALQYRTLSHLVEYGADHVMRVVPDQEDRLRHPLLGRRYAFGVCRIEPENNVHVLLAAFCTLPLVPLAIVGNWENSEYGRNLRAQYGHFPNLHLLDPIYHQRELDVLRSNCHVYLHGHSAGGTNPSLVEAMFLGLPVLVFDVSYNKATTEDKALYFSNAYDLHRLIASLSDQELHRNREAMKEIANRRYTWEIVASKYASLVLGFDYQYQKKGLYPQVASLGKDTLNELGIAHLGKSKLFFE